MDPKPTIGRVVLFHGAGASYPKPAIVTHVHEDESVDLEVFGVSFERFWTRVTRDMPDPAGLKLFGEFRWSWPPRT